jgi:zinc/manganese transport system permease protein
MGDAFALLLPAFAACLLLTGIHAYLGLHVVQRGVIFVDLALAQVAALGAACAFLLGFDPHGPVNYLMPLTFTFVGAGALAFSRLKDAEGVQEAIIGIVYVVAAAATILVLAQSAEGGEGLKALLVGHLLFVRWNELAITAALYVVVGWLHWRYRKPVYAITDDAKKAEEDGYRVWLWDFFFYATFGVVVTSSVKIAGVLLVFSFLVIPAVCAALLLTNHVPRLLAGWGIGFLGSAIGVSCSYVADLPTGATVVCAFGGLFVTVLLLRRLLN